MIRIGLTFYPTIPPGIIHPEQAYFIPLKTLGSVLPGLTGFSFLFPPLMLISKKKDPFRSRLLTALRSSCLNSLRLLPLDFCRASRIHFIDIFQGVPVVLEDPFVSSLVDVDAFRSSSYRVPSVFPYSKTCEKSGSENRPALPSRSCCAH